MRLHFDAEKNMLNLLFCNNSDENCLGNVKEIISFFLTTTSTIIFIFIIILLLVVVLLLFIYIIVLFVVPIKVRW